MTASLFTHEDALALERLVRFAQDRLRAGAGVDRLRTVGLDHPDLLMIYGAGYLPADVADVLSLHDAERFAGIDLADRLVLPAYDGDGRVVDLAVVDLSDGGVISTGIASSPHGLLGARVATVSPSVILVDRLADLVLHLRAGERTVVPLRGAADALANAARLHATGVQQVCVAVTRDAAAVADACTAAGLIVLDTSTTSMVPATELVAYQAEQHQAVFRCGDWSLVAEVPWQGSSVLEILVRRQTATHRDRFDLAVPAQRRRFAVAASRRTSITTSVLEAVLDDLLPQLQALLTADDAVPALATLEPNTDTALAAEITALLHAPNLMARFAADLTTLGWVGDEQAKHLLLLTLAGRVLADPPWLLLHGDAALTNPAMALLNEIVPPAHAFHLSRANEAALGHQGRDGLRHRVLMIDDARRLTAETVTRLHLLQTRSGLAVPTNERDAVTGRRRTGLREARGPVAVVAAATGVSPLAGLAIVAPLDDSPAQTQRALLAARQRRQQPLDAAAQSRIIGLWRGLFAALPASPVMLPFADRVEFPNRRPQHRRDQERFFALVDASALLHQHQRLRSGDAVVATEMDFACAECAVHGLIGIADDGLSERAQALLGLIRAANLTAFTRPQLAMQLPQWPRSTLYDALDDLMRLDLLASPDGGKGRHARVYRLLPAAFSGLPTASAIHLRAIADAVPETITGIAGNGSGNLSPMAASG